MRRLEEPGLLEQGARVRRTHALALLEGHIDAVKSHIKADLPTPDIRQNLTLAVQALGEQLALIDAFRYQRECDAYRPHIMCDHPETDRCRRCGKTRAEAPDGCEAPDGAWAQQQ